MYAMILSGGKGERLMPLTANLPKPMVPVARRPILWYQVQWLKQVGVTDVVFLSGYKWAVIKDYFGDGAEFGVRVHYSVEDAPLGRGGAIRKGFAMVPRSEQLVFATNGDTLTDEDPRRLLEAHRKGRHAATLMLVPLHSPYGVVEVGDQDRVVAFREKIRLPHWINAGVYVLNRDLEEGFPVIGDHEDSTFPLLAKEGRLGALRSQAFWRPVDNFKDLHEAEDAVKSGLIEPARWRPGP